MAKLNVKGKSLIYTLFLINTLVLLGSIAFCCITAYFYGAVTTYISPVSWGLVVYLIWCGLLTLGTSLLGSITKLTHHRIWMIFYCVSMATCIGLLLYIQFGHLLKLLDDSNNSKFSDPIVAAFNEENRNGRGKSLGPTVMQRAIQNHFSCCGLDTSLQYCNNKTVFEATLDTQFQRNAENANNPFNAGDVVRHMTDPECGAPAINENGANDDDQWCPSSWLVRIKEMPNPTTKETIIGGGACRDVIIKHFKRLIRWFFIFNWVLLGLEALCLGLAIITAVLDNKLDKEKDPYQGGDAALMQSTLNETE